ncbi:hypothetical protein AAA151_06105 [[Clostridium] innocuum]|jgi:hypothetical protein
MILSRKSGDNTIITRVLFYLENHTGKRLYGMLPKAVKELIKPNT